MPILMTYLYSDVVRNGSVSAAYPSGFSPDSFDKSGAKACLGSAETSLPVDSYSLSWGASAVTVTSLKDTWTAGVSLFVSVPNVVNGQGEEVRAIVDPVTGWNRISAGTAPDAFLDQGVKRRRLRGGERVFTSGPSSMSAYTMAGQFPALGAFDAVRVVYENPSTNSGANATFDTTKVAVTPTAGNAGSSLTWVPVTFSGATPIALSAGSGSSSDFVPSFARSDIIALGSVARSDGSFPLTQLRSYAAGTFNCFGVADAQVTGYATAFTREFRFGRAAGVVADGAALAPTGIGYVLPAFIEYFYRLPTVTIACVGDSIMSGSDGTNLVGSAIERFAYAHNAADATMIVVPQNHANSGQKIPASIATANAILATIPPDFLVFCAYSVNDAITTQAQLDADWILTLALIDACYDKGVMPVLCTANPRTGLSLNSDNLRKQQNARVRAMSNAVIVIDYDALTSDQASPASYLSGYSVDGTHPSTTGHAAMQAAVTNSRLAHMLC